MSGVARSIFKSICGRTGRGVTGGAERSPWVTDIHNGISNPLFTYTGGQAIVPDEDGILRRTPAGYPAVEGGRWVSTLAEGALLGTELMAAPLTASHPSISLDGIGGIFTNTPNDSELFKNIGISANRIFRVSFEVYDYVSGAVISAAGLPYSIDPMSSNGIYTHDIVSVGNVNMSIKAIGVTTLKVRNISVREIIPQWLPPTAGTTRSISTRKGLRQIQTADTFLGMLVEPAMTNKCTCRKSNPTDTTGVTGAGGATVTRVLDTAALTEGGYQGICTTFYDYELSIPQNGTISIAGAVANLNKHSVSLDMRLVSGTGVQLGLTGQTSNVTLTAAFSRQKKENLTPLAITDVITITNLNADTAVVRCILPGLEQSAFCTSRIAPAADTAAAQTRAASVVSASTSGVFPSSGQDFAVFMRVVPGATGQGIKYYFSYTKDSSNQFAFLDNTYRGIIKQISGTAETTYTGLAVQIDVPIEIIMVQTSSGMSHKERRFTGGSWDSWGNWSNNTSVIAKSPVPIASTYAVGVRLSLNQFIGNYPRTAIIAMPPKATLAEYQTWIDEELTRRGLI